MCRRKEAHQSRSMRFTSFSISYGPEDTVRPIVDIWFHKVTRPNVVTCYDIRFIVELHFENGSRYRSNLMLLSADIRDRKGVRST
jgi:hypothetical protein